MVYPRACGGTAGSLRARWRARVYPRACGGLSPRLRGNRTKLIPKITDLRSIPAPAGEPPCGVIFSIRLLDVRATR